MSRVVLSLALCAAACVAPPPTYHHDVEPVVRARCAGCHDGSGIAPLPLRDYSEVSAAKAVVRDAVEQRIMPPWGASRACAGYEADASLTDEQIETIVRWVSEGAAEGEPGPGAAVPPFTPGLSRVDLELPMPERYAPPPGQSSYRCFVIDWPLTEATHITGFRARPGNVERVHHALAYAAPPEVVPDFRALDAADEGPGYACAAGPGLIDRRVSWVGSWEPGSQGDEYPGGTGFAVVPGSALVVQLHYDGTFGDDLTTFELKLERDVEREAWVMTWADPGWITTDTGMLIRAGDAHATHAYFADPTVLQSDGQPLTVRGVSLHLHRLGTRGGLSIRHPDGSSSCLLDIPRWDFGWQRSYRLASPRELRPGDRLGIECEWDNSAENQPLSNGAPRPPRDRSWGPGTDDEMCMGALLVTK